MPVFTKAQSIAPNPQYVGLRAHNGIIWAHSPDLIPQSYSQPNIYQVEWSRMALSDRAWENCHCYSKFGVAFQYVNFNNPNVLGSGYALMAFTEPFLTYQRRLYITMRAGIGPVFLDQVYDAQTNPENLFFSAPISFVLALNASLNFRLTEQWHLSATGHYNHISNGGVKLPNKGINYPTFGLGIDYVLRPVTLSPRTKTQDYDREIQPYIGTFFSPRKTRADQSEKAYEGWMIGVQTGAVKPIGSFSAVGLGMELSHDGSLANRQVDFPESTAPVIASVMVQYYLTFGQFSFSPQLGYYVYRDAVEGNAFFQRWALVYTTGSEWYVGTSLKAHGHVAEHIDVHVGKWIKR
jgi:hypothetical protein